MKSSVKENTRMVQRLKGLLMGWKNQVVILRKEKYTDSADMLDYCINEINALLGISNIEDKGNKERRS